MSSFFGGTRHEKCIEIIKAIRRTSPLQERIFMEGSCYQLFPFLKIFFEDAEAYCCEDGSHVIVKLDDRFYDIRGEVSKKEFKQNGFAPITATQEEKLMHNHACLLNGNIMAIGLERWKGEVGHFWIEATPERKYKTKK